MAKLYGPEFEAGLMSCYPNKAISYDSLTEMLDAYQAFLDDCDRYGETPNDAWIFIGTPTGDEEQYGYPDYPDYIVEPNMDESGEYRLRVYRA